MLRYFHHSEVFHKIVPVLEAYQSEWGDCVGQIYQSLADGEATILGDEEGFLIAQILDGGELYIWILFGSGGNYIQKHLPQMKAIAKEHGCNKLIFKSNRKGFKRLLTPEWKVRAVEYELEIVDGVEEEAEGQRDRNGEVAG